MLSSNGFVNLLVHLALRLRGPAWLDSSAWALPAIMLMTVWQFTGYYTLLVLSGLQSIPHEVEEAARIDGAGGVRLAWFVTLPLLSPTLLFCIVVSVSHSFRVFDQIYVMTGGGPGTATMTLVFSLYQQGFSFFILSRLGWINRYGRSSSPSSPAASASSSCARRSSWCRRASWTPSHIDGAGHWTILSRILFPLARPAALTLAALSFVFHPTARSAGGSA